MSASTMLGHDGWEAIAAMRHHADFNSLILRMLPLAREPASLDLLHMQNAATEDLIAQALALDERLPHSDDLLWLSMEADHALHGQPATAIELSRLLPILLTGRPARPETISMRLFLLMEQVAFECEVRPFSVDVLALAVLNDLRSNRYPPEPADFIAGIEKARQQIADVADAISRLLETRCAVDEVLFDAGVRECPEDYWFPPDHYKGMPRNCRPPSKRIK